MSHKEQPYVGSWDQTRQQESKPRMPQESDEGCLRPRESESRTLKRHVGQSTRPERSRGTMPVVHHAWCSSNERTETKLRSRWSLRRSLWHRGINVTAISLT